MKHLKTLVIALSAFILFGGSSLAGTNLYHCLDKLSHNVYTDSPTQLTHCEKLIVKDHMVTIVNHKYRTSNEKLIVAQLGISPSSSASSPMQENPIPEQDVPAPSPESNPSEPSPHPEGALDPAPAAFPDPR